MIIKLEKVNYSFPGAVLPTLKEISLEIADGDFCVVIGANGSGKSTLLKVISGELHPESGKILRNGKESKNLRIAKISQDINKSSISRMTVLENMSLSMMRTHHANFRFYSRRYEEISTHLKMLNRGLEDSLQHPMGKLSGGERQMIVMMMAVCSAPQLLLCDEHTSALDPKMQKRVMDLTAQMIEQYSLTSLIITHKLEDAVKYGNRLIMLHHGRVVLDISGNEKSTLSVSTLLNYFHQFEEQDLRSEVQSDN